MGKKGPKPGTGFPPPDYVRHCNEELEVATAEPYTPERPRSGGLFPPAHKAKEMLIAWRELIYGVKKRSD